MKDRCASIIQLEFSTIGSAAAIAHLVDKQLSNYFYTYPMASNVSVEVLVDSN